MYKDRRIARRGVFHAAGWLFADLLLALTIIFLAASTTGKAQSPTPTPSAIPTQTPTPTPVLLQTLDPRPLEITMSVNPSQLNSPNTISNVKNQIMLQLNQSRNGNRKVGFVITLAGGIDGVSHATSFNAILKTLSPFQEAVFKNYHDLNSPATNFDLEIYFLNQIIAD